MVQYPNKVYTHEKLVAGHNNAPCTLLLFVLKSKGHCIPETISNAGSCNLPSKTHLFLYCHTILHNIANSSNSTIESLALKYKAN